MSRILIISDSHFLRKQELQQFIDSIPSLDAVIHCGDIYIGYKDNDFKNMYICKGNNDFTNLPRILNFEIDNVRFTITHGHLNNYAYDPQSLSELIEDYPSDIICFGHTHVPYVYQQDNLIILNPGSLALSRTYPRVNTYIIFDTVNKEAHFYNAKTKQEIKIKES